MGGPHQELIAQLRTTLAKMEIALGAVADAIVWVDEQGSIQWCNATFDRLVGKAHIELLGVSLAELLPWDHPPGILRGDSPEYAETLEYRREGVRTTLEVIGKRIVPTEPGGGAVFVFRDVTLRAQLMREHLARLEAEARVRDRDEFMLVAAHELRTPLTALRLHVEVMMRLAAGGEAQRVAALQAQLNRLAALIERLLDVSKISVDRIELNRREVDLSALVKEVIASFQPEAARAGCPIELHVSGPVRGLWDPTRLQQVVLNLLGNAVKYGTGRPITVTLDAVGERAVLSVEDCGIGIAREDQERIFERYERAVSPRRYAGLGVGLYVTRQIVLAHQGTIRVESEPGRGARFTVELPVAP